MKKSISRIIGLIMLIIAIIFIMFVTTRNVIKRLEVRQSAIRQAFRLCVEH